MKSRLNCLLFAERWSQDDKLPSRGRHLKSVGANEKKLTTDDAPMEADLEDEQLWAKMEVVTAKSKKQKTLTTGNSGKGKKGGSGKKRKECSVTVEMDSCSDSVVKTKHKKGRIQQVDSVGINKKTSKDVTKKMASESDLFVSRIPSFCWPFQLIGINILLVRYIYIYTRVDYIYIYIYTRVDIYIWYKFLHNTISCRWNILWYNQNLSKQREVKTV